MANGQADADGARPDGVADERIVRSGMLVRDGAGFALRCDDGATLALELGRVPVDHVGKRVRIEGVPTSPGLLEVEAIRGG